jgi:hypothetical protein
LLEALVRISTTLHSWEVLVDRLRLLFGALFVMFAVLVPTGAASASEAPVAPAARMGPVASESAIVLMTGFYCPGATAPDSPCMPCRPDVGSASCPMAYKASPAGGPMFLQITNHANYGEHCRIHVPGGFLGNAWIDQGDNSEHLMGTIIKNESFQVRCQRRAATGDAGIGGYLWVHSR